MESKRNNSLEQRICQRFKEMAGWKVVTFRLLPFKSSVKSCLLLKYFNKMRHSDRDFQGINSIYIGTFLLNNRVKLVLIVHLYGFEETK